MARRRLPRTVWSAILFALLTAFAGALPAQAQTPSSNPNHMCGDGEFEVELPGLPRAKLGIDDLTGIFQSIEFPDKAKDDLIKLPKGCRIYAFLFSGFADNEEYDHITFYNVAEFVAQNGGYVHVGWWNNLTAPYMERPLHNDSITIKRLLLPDYNIPPGPKAPGIIPDEFFNTILDLPKANPDDDYQFVEDLRVTLRAVRDQNPEALIIVAGHSMGANAIARVGAMPGVEIDLLAPIDPVGNRDIPRGGLLTKKFNWTRWRATHDFKGWKIRDCVRDGLFCKNFGTFFSPSFWCRTVGDWLPDPPPLGQGSHQKLLCPGHYEDPGPTLTLGANVKHLYHRWQHEDKWPVDYHRTELFNRPAANDTTNIDVQAPVDTCAIGFDPQRPLFLCNPKDGHGELVGYRNPSGIIGLGRLGPGVQLTDWPTRTSTNAALRRERLLQLPELGANWPYRPFDPDLCLVCGEINGIIRFLLGGAPTSGDTLPPDTQPPTSHASASPEANAQGWFNEDVVVTVSANDNRSVQAIELTLSGAQTSTTTTPGNSAETTIGAEGLTTVSYFARDGSNNAEPAHSLDVRIDKTAPQVNALVDIPPNQHGWNRSPVVISFVASDEAGGSGIAASSPDTSVDTEGANQEIAGSAEDNAGNTGAALATLNIDLTPPTITFESRGPAANGAGWNTSPVTVTWTCTDAFSGLLASSDAVTVDTEGAGQSAIGTCRDRADHVSTDTVANINVDMAPPVIALDNRAPAANAAGWNNSPVTVTWSCTDAVSGVLAGSDTTIVGGEGSAQSAAGTCRDNAGHVATDTVTGIKIDTTAPAIALESRLPAANAAGWNNTAVAITWTCTDALSGAVDPTVSASIAGQGLGQSGTGVCADAAANTESHTQGDINIDLTTPGAALASPANGAIYLLNATVPAEFACSDALSGVASCAGTLASGALIDTSSPGGKTFTVTAADRAANATSVTHAYSVHYNFTGFTTPIRSGINQVNGGRTVPVKFSLADANAAFVTTLASFVSLTSTAAACDTGEVFNIEGEAESSTQTTIRYDAGTNQFIYNWKTENGWAGSCRNVTLTLADGTEHVVRFRFQ